MYIIVNIRICYLDAFTAYPGNSSLIATSILIFLKFVILKNLNNRKKRIYAKKGEVLEMNIFFRFLKILNSELVTLIIIIFLLIIFAIIQVIMFSIYQFQCFSSDMFIIDMIYIGIISIMFFFGLFLVIYDLFLNYKKIIYCNFISFMREDIYFIRFEAYLLGLIFSGGSFIFYIILYYLGDPYIYPAVQTFTFFSLYIFFSGFSLLITIIRFIKDLIVPPISTEGCLSNFLNTDDGFNIMQEFCKRGK